MDAKKIVIENQEYDLPEGFEPLGNEGLYLVDWSLVDVAELVNAEEKEFKFFNPRHLGQYDQDKNGDNFEHMLGEGFSKPEMRELMNDIVQNGIENVIHCYFVFGFPKDKDGKPATTEPKIIKARVHDGERRYLCVERARDKDMQVYCRQTQQFKTAKNVYAKVLCKIDCMTEEEAFRRACAISETAKAWGDGANARLVKMLYAKGKTDDEICKLLNKSKPWLAETASLNELDDYCFSFLLSGKINRKVALDLAKINNDNVRQTWLQAAWKDALENHANLQVKNEKLLKRAEAQEEMADAEVEEAKGKGDPVKKVAELEVAASEASEKTKKRKQIKAASAKPMVKSKNLQKAGGFLNALRAPKIKKKLEKVEEMIEKNDTTVDMKILHVLKVAYQCILEGEDDINVVIKKLSA